jgi:hypothetical protein
VRPEHPTPAASIRTGGSRSRGVLFWYSSLRALAALNLALWSLTALLHFDTAGASSAQLLLSLVYVGGCAFRSFLPLIDIPRLVLIDSAFSSVLIGRSVATAAELCFALQWALMLHAAALLAGSPWAQAVSWAVLPLIALAEVFSWYAVLTTRQRPHAAENSLWGLSAALVVAGVLAIGAERMGSLHLPIVAGGTAYVAFIFFYDVPMYWARWRSDQASGRSYLSLAEGLAEVRSRRQVSWRWEDWRSEVPWMTLYFSCGVWSSLWLVGASAGRG